MKINSSYILLKEIRCYAYHGVAPQENLIGNEYIIDLKLKVDISKATRTDEVTDTVNYAEVHQVIKNEMAIPSKLLEHVSGRIIQKLFAQFPCIEEILHFYCLFQEIGIKNYRSILAKLKEEFTSLTFSYPTTL